MPSSNKTGLTADMIKVFDTLPNRYLVLSEDLIILAVSNLYLDIVGKTRKDLIGKYLFDAFSSSPSSDNDILQSLQKVRLTKKPDQLPTTRHEVANHNGVLKERYWLTSHTPVLRKNGDIDYIIHCTDDVTIQVQAEHQTKAILRKERYAVTLSEQRFSVLLNAIPQQVWTSRPDGTLDYANEIACAYFAKSPEDMIGKGWRDFVHPEDLPQSIKAWKNALETGKEYVVEFRLLMYDGTYQWHLGRAIPLVENGQIKLWLGTNTNIDLQKSNEQKKDEFLSIASHELKTPLTSIKAFNQLMQRTKEPDKLGSFIEKSAERIIRLEKIINDLLDVTKINAGKMTYNWEDFDFRQMLLDNIESISHISTIHEIVLECDIDVLYKGDRFRIEQVVSNFLTNALKYSPNGGKILVKGHIQLDNIIVSVQDFGIGIAAEDLDKLFERYFRVDNTAMRFEGLGLGLFISSEILKRHHGSFWIESQPGEGSTFYFRLPITKEPDLIPVEDNDTFYQDSTIRITYNQKNKCLYIDWLGFQNMETVQHGCLAAIKMLNKNQVTKIFNDNTHVLGTWSEAAEWVGTEVFPLLEKAGVKYFAWVFAPVAFSQLAARKSVDIAEGNIITQFFTDLSSAEKWLHHK